MRDCSRRSGGPELGFALALLAVLTAVACGPALPPTPTSLLQASPTPTPEAVTAASAAPTPTFTSARTTQVSASGQFALVSPDGTKVVSVQQGGRGGERKYLIQDLRGGAVLREYVDTKAGGRFEWLPDSSGVLIELAAGQRAGPLGVFSVTGGIRETGLDYANVAISPDRRWIAAERQEGCCVAIRVREIRIAPFAGGPARTLVTTTAPDAVPAPISLLGWDGEAVIYRDGSRIFRTTLDGQRSELALPQSAAGRTIASSRGTSPDQKAILACAADPQRFWVIAGGALLDLPSTLRPAWPTNDPWCGPDTQPVPWIGGHDLVLRDATGKLVAFDPMTGATRALAVVADAVLAASGDVLLVRIGTDVLTISLATGEQRRVDLAATELFVQPIAGGRFFITIGGSALVVG